MEAKKTTNTANTTCTFSAGGLVIGGSNFTIGKTGECNGFFSFYNKENLKPKRIIFNGLTTICFWPDGTKTMVKCGHIDIYDREFAVAMCIAHKIMGSKAQFKKFVESGYEAMNPYVDKERQLNKLLRKDTDEFPF